MHAVYEGSEKSVTAICTGVRRLFVRSGDVNVPQAFQPFPQAQAVLHTVEVLRILSSRTAVGQYSDYLLSPFTLLSSLQLFKFTPHDLSRECYLNTDILELQSVSCIAGGMDKFRSVLTAMIAALHF